jgi:nitrogen fixation protein FixH
MKRELSGRGVLIWLLAFFGVILAVNVYFMGVAIRTFRGEDDLKPYQEGIDYNQTLARRAAQARLGWEASIDAVRTGPHTARLDVLLRGPDGSPVSHVGLAAEFRHPSDENRDRSTALREIGAGDYEGDLGSMTAGAWDVIVKTSDPHVPFEATRRVWLP